MTLDTNPPPSGRYIDQFFFPVLRECVGAVGSRGHGAVFLLESQRRAPLCFGKCGRFEEKQRNQQSYFLIWRASLGGEGHLPVGKGMLSVRKGTLGVRDWYSNFFCPFPKIPPVATGMHSDCTLAAEEGRG